MPNCRQLKDLVSYLFTSWLTSHLSSNTPLHQTGLFSGNKQADTKHTGIRIRVVLLCLSDGYEQVITLRAFKPLIFALTHCYYFSKSLTVHALSLCFVTSETNDQFQIGNNTTLYSDKFFKKPIVRQSNQPMLRQPTQTHAKANRLSPVVQSSITSGTLALLKALYCCC